MVVRLDPPHRHKNVLNIIENFDRIALIRQHRHYVS